MSVLLVAAALLSVFWLWRDQAEPAIAKAVVSPPQPAIPAQVGGPGELVLRGPRSLDLAEPADRRALITAQLLLESSGPLTAAPFKTQIALPPWLGPQGRGQAYLLSSKSEGPWRDRLDEAADALLALARQFPSANLRSIFATKLDSPAPKAFDSCWSLRGDDAEALGRAMSRLKSRLGAKLWLPEQVENPLEQVALRHDMERADGLARLFFTTAAVNEKAMALPRGLAAARCGRGAILNSGDLMRTFPDASWFKPLPGGWLSADQRWLLVHASEPIELAALGRVAAQRGLAVEPAGPPNGLSLTAATAAFDGLDFRHPDIDTMRDASAQRWLFRRAESLGQDQFRGISERLPKGWVIDALKN